MKNEKDSKPKASVKTKDAPKAKKPQAKKSKPAESGADIKNEVESIGYVKAAPDSVFALMKNTANIAELETWQAVEQLGEHFSETQISQMFFEEKTLPTPEFIFAANKGKLDKIITDKGWNLPAEFTNVTEENAPEVEQEHWVTHTEYAETQPEEEFVEPLSYDLEEGASGAEDVPVINTGEVDLEDPNENLFNEFPQIDTFNQKERALLIKLAKGTKTVAALSEVENKLWTSISTKYEKHLQPQTADGQEPIENFRKPDALAKTDDVIQGLIEPEDTDPLTDEERAELAEREKAIEDAKNNLDTAIKETAFIMSENLAEIRKKKLHRETGLSFKAYVEDRFKIDDKYAHSLAQVGEFRLVLNEISDTAKQLAGTVRSNAEWLRNTNQIAEILHIGKSDFEAMKPIIESVESIVAELATDENGKLSSAAPRIFSAAQEIIIEVVNNGNVEIDGEQISIKDANDLGILEKAVQSQIVDTVAENIKVKRQEIIDHYKEQKERRTKPHEPVPPKKAEKQYEGVVPTYFARCTNTAHKAMNLAGENVIVNVFNAGFEFACSCKFQRLTTSGDEFVCIETDGLEVQHD